TVPSLLKRPPPEESEPAIVKAVFIYKVSKKVFLFKRGDNIGLIGTLQRVDCSVAFKATAARRIGTRDSQSSFHL
ncbi:MAG: hypothetical protein IKP64_02375, partial [Selenomonadaceae bacterium]|nr:hypothetical protein [Selenomonadaceae bacterium]